MEAKEARQFIEVIRSLADEKNVRPIIDEIYTRAPAENGPIARATAEDFKALLKAAEAASTEQATLERLDERHDSEMVQLLKKAYGAKLEALRAQTWHFLDDPPTAALVVACEKAGLDI